jgi:hypothetical protein
MMPKLVIHIDAERQFDEAREWYEQQQRGLGTQLEESINDSLNQILSSPQLFPIAIKRIHKKRLKIFPYNLFYSQEANTIYVYALYHTSRNPDAWKKHLRKFM